MLIDIARSILKKPPYEKIIASKLSSSETLIGFFHATTHVHWLSFKIIVTWAAIILLSTHLTTCTEYDIDYIILPLTYVSMFISLFWWCYVPHYHIAVTDQGLHIHKLNWLWETNVHAFMLYNKIPQLVIKKGFFNTTLELMCTNNQYLKLNIPHVIIGKRQNKIVLINKHTLDYLVSKTTLLQQNY